MPRRDEAALAAHIAKDPETDSEFAETKARAAAKKVAPGVDPDTGETVAVSRRSLFNAFDGDERRANEVFDELATKGGYGNIENPNQFIDIRGLARSVKEERVAADRAEDLWERKQAEARAAHQDGVYNDVMEALERAKRG